MFSLPLGGSMYALLYVLSSYHHDKEERAGCCAFIAFKYPVISSPEPKALR